MPTGAFCYGRNEQVDALQSNQLWLVWVAYLPKVMHQETGMLKGFTVAFWADADATAATCQMVFPEIQSQTVTPS
jgi:hypothetical protein